MLTLSAREMEILQLIVDGKDNREIASALHLATSTVRTHRARISGKVGAKNSYELIRIALSYFGDEMHQSRAKIYGRTIAYDG